MGYSPKPISVPECRRFLFSIFGNLFWSPKIPIFCSVFSETASFIKRYFRIPCRQPNKLLQQFQYSIIPFQFCRKPNDSQCHEKSILGYLQGIQLRTVENLIPFLMLENQGRIFRNGFYSRKPIRKPKRVPEWVSEPNWVFQDTEIFYSVP